ncbi:hypothetical protein T4D_4292 [Trichinella pseudospiralis]|uniref:Uncharacterized protein n=1 Tax=Trichinella pseudospiralis TaxID=6337 RepID=A0A0V1FRY1_TRIPS|nr:hypothetical protein T4D_4292 [Trichinella pseudospiralis]
MEFESMMVEDGTFGQEKEEGQFETDAVFNDQTKYFSNTDHLSNSSEQTDSIDEQEAEEEKGQQMDESEHEEKEKDEDAIIMEKVETEEEEEEEEEDDDDDDDDDNDGDDEENVNNNNNAEDENEEEKVEDDDEEEKKFIEIDVKEDVEIEKEKDDENENELPNMEYNDDQVDQDQLIYKEIATQQAADEAVDVSESEQMHEEENDEDTANKNKDDKSINSFEEWMTSKEQVEIDANANNEIQKSNTENETITIINAEADAKDDSISIEQNMEKEEIGDSTGEELDDQSEFSDEETEAQNKTDYATLDTEKNETSNDIQLQKNSTCENVELKQFNEEPLDDHQIKVSIMENTEEIQEIDNDDTEQSNVEKIIMDETDKISDDEISIKIETEKHIDQPIYLDISTGYTYAITAEEEQTEVVENSNIISDPKILSEQCPEIVETHLSDKEEEVEQVKEDQQHENHIVKEDVESFTHANSPEEKIKDPISETIPLNGEILVEEIVKDDQINLTENEKKDNVLESKEERINEQNGAEIEIIEERQIQPAVIEMKTSDILELNDDVELAKKEETKNLINNEEINETILNKVEMKEDITEKVNEVGKIIDQEEQDAEQVKQQSGQRLTDSSKIVKSPDNAEDQMNGEKKEENIENLSDGKISEIPIHFIEIKQTDDMAENMNEIAVEIFEQKPDDAKGKTDEKQSELKQKDEVDDVKKTAEDLNNNDISEKNNNYLLTSKMENEMKESSEKINIDEETVKPIMQQVENEINKSSVQPVKVEMNKQENLNEKVAQKYDTSEEWKIIDAEVEEIKKRRNRQTHDNNEIKDSYPFLPSRSSASLSLSSSYYSDFHSRPMNHYVSIFDNQVNTGPFSQSSYGSLTRSRSRSRERLGYSNIYRTSSFSKLSSYHDFDNIRWTKPSTQIPLRSTSFTTFMDYYDKVKDNLHRTYSNQKLYERKTYTPRWIRSESRNNFWNYYDQLKRDLRRTYVKPSLYESKPSYSIFPIRSRSFDRLSSYYRRMKTEFRNANAYFKSTYTRPFSRIRSFYRPWKFDTYLF